MDYIYNKHLFPDRVFTFFCSDLSQCCSPCVTEPVSIDLFAVSQLKYKYMHVYRCFLMGIRASLYWKLASSKCGNVEVNWYPENCKQYVALSTYSISCWCAFEQSASFLKLSSRVVQLYDSDSEIRSYWSYFRASGKCLSPLLPHKHLQAVTLKEESPFNHPDLVKRVKKKCSVRRSLSSIDRASVSWGQCEGLNGTIQRHTDMFLYCSARQHILIWSYIKCAHAKNALVICQKQHD